jgi:hypothetical protein
MEWSGSFDFESGFWRAPKPCFIQTVLMPRAFAGRMSLSGLLPAACFPDCVFVYKSVAYVKK